MTQVGRPKFEVDLEKLRELAALGLKREAIAAELGCHLSTLCERQRENPEISETIQEARAGLQREVADVLLEQALGGDVQACKFILERRCGWRNEQTIVHKDDNPRAERQALEAKLEAAGYDLEELKRIRRRPPATIEH